MLMVFCVVTPHELTGEVPVFQRAEAVILNSEDEGNVFL
jgi:hypothetical protein